MNLNTPLRTPGWALADKLFRQAKPENLIPDGEYDVIIRSVELTESRATGAPLIRWDLEVQSPHVEARAIQKFSSFGSETAVKILRKELTICGVYPDTLDELEECLPLIEGLVLQVYARMKGDFLDVTIKKRLTGGSAAATTDLGNRDA